jgi:hypothetical protein
MSAEFNVPEAEHKEMFRHGAECSLGAIVTD